MATGLGQSGDTGHCSATSRLCITAATLQSGASAPPHFQNQLNSQWGHTSCLLPFPWSVPMTPWWFSPTSSQLGSAVKEAAPACLISSTLQGDPMGGISLPHRVHSHLASINSWLTLQHSYLLFQQLLLQPSWGVGKSMPPGWAHHGCVQACPGSTAGTGVPLPTQAGGAHSPHSQFEPNPPMMSQAPHLPAEVSHPTKMSGCAQTGSTWCWWAPRVPRGVGVQGQLISPISKSNC